MIKKYGVDARCGRRGCKVVELPFDASPNRINCGTNRIAIGVYRLPIGGAPSWKVLRWDIDEDADQPRKAFG
jgi:hypothetical protein